MARGRGKPSKYDTHVGSKLVMISEWAIKGLTDKDICTNLRIAVSTFCSYKLKYPELVEALKGNKDEADLVVENSMYKNAVGFEYEEVTEELVDGKMQVTRRVTKLSAPNTTAGIYWLNNRQPKKFRTKQEIENNIVFGLRELTEAQTEDLINRYTKGGQPDE